jgi:hypothetical protein
MNTIVIKSIGKYFNYSISFLTTLQQAVEFAGGFRNFLVFP